MPLKIQRIDARCGDAQAAIAQLRAKLAPGGNVVSEAGRRKTLEVFGKPLSPAEVVEQICSDVRTQGLPAVLRFTAKLDGAELTAETLRVPADALSAAHAKVSPDFLSTIRRIRENILRFQTAILHRDVEIDAPPIRRPSDEVSAGTGDPRTTASGPSGGKLRQRYLPLERVGICVPGGAAAYPSTVLMTAVPAQAAGVEEIVVVSPPTPNGAYNEGVLATCHELGVREVYRVGGAQGVAALAY
jgi:histidinol dehydrogenase